MPKQTHEMDEQRSLPTMKGRQNNVPIVVNGEALTMEQLMRVARGATPVQISRDAEVLDRLHGARAFVEHAVRHNLRVYGVTTGVGGMSHVPLTAEQASEFQNNLLCFLHCGTGRRLPNADVRAAMLLRLNSLVRGASGVRYELLERIECFLNEGITPHVYEFGSIGASGDLVPLSHIAGALIGLADWFRVDFRGEEMEAVRALRLLDLPHLTLQPKEGLALVNGTSMMTAMAARCWHDAQTLLALTLGAHGLMMQALAASNQSFHPFLHACKPHPGQARVAEEMLRLLEGAIFIRNELQGGLDAQGEGLAQDRYSLRCLPQFIGPVVEGLWHIAGQLQTEMNSSNDNPLIDARRQVAYHGGNFLGQYVGLAMDQLRSFLGLLAKHLDAQIALLMAPEFSNGLPGSLVGNARRPVNMGLKGLQLVGNSLMPLLTFFGNSFVDRFPTHAEQFNQNINSQGFGAAWLARQSIEMYQQYLSVALLIGTQAVELRAAIAKGTHDPRAYLSPATRSLYEAVRAIVQRPPQANNALVWNDAEQSLDEYLRCLQQDIMEEGLLAQAVLPTRMHLTTS